MSGFAPSPEAAQANLPRNKVERREHPGGAEGVKMSLEEVAKHIKEGRNDPRVKAWAGKVLIAAGKPSDESAQVQALLDAFRRQTMYVPDPVKTEMIAKPHVTLCLDEHGLCMPASDCDDRSVAMGSAIMSIGIPVRVVGQAFDSPPTIATHVIIKFEDQKRGWTYLDPSSDTFPVGKAFPATREWELDPLSDKGMVGGPMRDSGDFVSIGSPPQGVGQVAAAAQAAVVDQLQHAVFAVKKSRDDLGAALQQIFNTRLATNPAAPFDPEPVTPIRSVAEFPGDKTWTQSMDVISGQLYDILDRMAQYGDQALAGQRQILVDQPNQAAYVQTLPTDAWSLHAVIQTTEEIIFGFYDKAGNLLSGFGSKDGASYSAAQVKSMSATTPAQGTGAAPVIIFGVVVGLVVVAVATYFIVSKMADVASTQAKEASYQSTMQAVSSGKMTPQQAQTLTDTISKNRIAEAQAQANTDANNPFSSSLKSVENIVTWVVVGGLLVSAVVVVGPLVQNALTRRRATA